LESNATSWLRALPDHLQLTPKAALKKPFFGKTVYCHAELPRKRKTRSRRKAERVFSMK
jgi:hypothetical protein